MDVNSRLQECWKIQDCGNCIRSESRCGWCPYSSTCIPASSLLDPIANPDICPHWAERWELRTKALGCGCSTTTLLTSIVTIFCTIAGLIVLYGVWVMLLWASRVWGPGSWGGWYLEIEDDGKRKEATWVRRSWWRPGWLWVSKTDAKARYDEQRRLLDS